MNHDCTGQGKMSYVEIQRVPWTLTQWCHMLTHIWVSIDSGYGLFSGGSQAITWTNVKGSGY